MQAVLKAILAALLLPLLLSGCVHGANKGSGSGPQRVRLATLPVESEAFPDLAEWVNNLLEEAKIRGVDDYFRSKVTLEVVQLSIECVDPTPACYTAAGHSLSSNKLLFAQIQGGTHRRHKSVHVTVTLFDADAGAPVQVADRSFKDQRAALGEVEELVQEVTGSAADADGAQPRKAPAPAPAPAPAAKGERP